MGVDNRARRAAAKRKRARQRARTGRQDEQLFSAYTGRDDRLVAESVARAVKICAADPRTADDLAVHLLRHGATGVVAGMVAQLVAGFVAAVVRAGWGPGDLAEITRRRLTGEHLPALAALLGAERDRHPRDRVAAAWRGDLDQLGRPRAADCRTRPGLARALGLAGLLSRLPTIPVLIPPPGTSTEGGRVRAPAGGGDNRMLARVRALLAKAESTEFPEEAEALSAKAQELISRYALGRLVDEVQHGAGPSPVSARRLWIDAPYVYPKAMLIGAVARANRCDAVISEDLGFSTVVGEQSDLDAVELLTTSLLVQADAAMLRHGRHADRGGRSRTASFRRSFLIAYATRIGERLMAATQEATDEADNQSALLPVLVRREEQVRAARDEMFPHLESRRTTISNTAGWVAGLAAADQAQLDAARRLGSAAG